MMFGVANCAENCTISWFIYFYKNGSRSEVSNGKVVNVELKKIHEGNLTGILYGNLSSFAGVQ